MVFPHIGGRESKVSVTAVDLLGFGRSPKSSKSLYMLRDHIDVIERSVLEPYKVKFLHIVAHSLSNILALALSLAVKYAGAVKSLTMLAPPYFTVSKGANGSQYVLRMVAPRRVWPPIAMGLHGELAKLFPINRSQVYMDTVRDRLNCTVTIFHDCSDEVIPVECSLAVKSKIPRAVVKLVEGNDHITIVVGREKAFAKSLRKYGRKQALIGHEE